jgi:hypothetical protein
MIKPLLLLSLALVAEAHAISVELGPANYAYVSAGSSLRLMGPLGIAVDGANIAAASWDFINGGDLATLLGNQLITGSGGASGLLDFYLREAVSYSIVQNSYSRSGGGVFKTSFWFSDPGLGPLPPYPPPVYSEAQSGPSTHFESTGLLNPGHYWFEFRSMFSGEDETGDSRFAFTMKRVPEGGSSLLLLGLALGVLYTMKRTRVLT